MFHIRQTILLLFILAFFTSCGETIETIHAANPGVDTLVAVGYQTVSENNAPEINAVSHDAFKIQQMLTRIPFLTETKPRETYYCPADFGYEIALSFLSQGKSVLTGKVNVTGCRFLFLSNGHGYFADDMFWALLENCIGQQIPHSPQAFMPER
jgi:hypothetical protein